MPKKLFALLRITFTIVLFAFFKFTNGQTPISGKDYVPNQIVIKLKDNITIAKNKFQRKETGQENIDQILLPYHIKKLDRIFTNVDPNNLAFGRSSAAKQKTENFLHYQFEEADNIDVLDVVNKLKALPNVEFAEPNYLFFAGNVTENENSEIKQENNIKYFDNFKTVQNSNNIYNKVVWANSFKLDFLPPPPPLVVPNDPLFAQQHYIQTANIQQAWEVTTGDSTVIAVLDTGVDWLHPDLQGNIWINWAEYNGVAGVDDDGNGLIDDIRGWDWINADNNPMDDNLHGTHVAGIIAAKTNNGIGVSGVNWNAKIMCLKILQSTGWGDAVTIAKAVDYARIKGAKIINMSLGGSFESLTFKTALENAYANALLVGSAGNNGKCIGPKKCPDGKSPEINYPGAYSFVVGVQDRAQYSNYDQDGPFASGYYNLLNYDTYAPGTSIMNILVGGSYKSLTGTSMAAPVVAGIASLYMTVNPNYDKELLFTQLTQQQTGGYIDAYKLLTTTPTPDLKVAKFDIVDTCATCDNDGKADAGENINLRIYLKNYSARGDSISIKLSREPLADSSLIQFIQDSCYIGAVSPNSVTFSLSPLNIRIANNVAHGADYKINVTIKNKSGNTWTSQIVINFENAITLGGFINSNLTLLPNKYYYVTENVVIDNCRLTLMPGTVLNFSTGKSLRTTNGGVVIARGTKDSLITFTSNSTWSGLDLRGAAEPYSNANSFRSFLQTNYLNTVDTITRSSVLKYCIVENTYGFSNGVKGGILINNIFRFNKMTWDVFYGSKNTIVVGNNIINNTFGLPHSNSSPTYNAFNNRINNFPWNSIGGFDDRVSGLAIGFYPFNLNYGTNIFNNALYNINASSGNYVFNLPSTFYLGSTDSLLISNGVFDYFDQNSYNVLALTNIKQTACDSCPGIVWKMTFNDNEFKSNTSQPEDLVSLGNHKIKVFFNRVMDTTVRPTITFGQREPFNQVTVTNIGAWSSDKKSYTVYRDFVISDPAGIVNFAVSGVKDPFGMEIPYERSRFRINLQSSNSQSLNFGSTALCGKIRLDWDNLQTPGTDIIGYNLYRRVKTVNNSRQFKLLNTSLIPTNNYLDLRVNLDTAYDYKYTVVRGGMNNESDSSYQIFAQPLPSKMADANGDSTVNITDVVTAVNRILLKDPLPFVFKQTDMNTDGIINVLDVIGIINKILHPRGAVFYPDNEITTQHPDGKVNMYLSGDTLYANSEVRIGGMNYNSSNIKKWISNVAQWESVNLVQNSVTDKMTFTFNKQLDSKVNIPLAIVDANIDPRTWLVSSTEGRPVIVNWLGDIKKKLQTVSNRVKLSANYPNPVANQFSFGIENTIELSNFIVELVDVNGRKIATHQLGSMRAGIDIKTINTKNLKAGSYVVVYNWNEGQETFQQTVKIIKQ